MELAEGQGEGPLTSRSGLEWLWEGSLGKCEAELGRRGGKEEPSEGAEKARLGMGGEEEAPKQAAQQLGKRRDADTLWTLLQNGSVLASHEFMLSPKLGWEVVSFLLLGLRKQMLSKQLSRSLPQRALSWSGICVW
jgi:hypothetical protein